MMTVATIPLMDKGILDGKTAVITGAGSGIGRATALMFLAQGASVMGADLYPDRLVQLEDEIRRRGIESSRLLTFAGDASDYEFARSVVEKTVDGLGKLDILVNNAGGSMGFGGTTFVDLENEKWDLTLANNLYTALNCTQHALRQMIPQSSGNIVNLGSTQGLGDSNVGGDLFAVYAAAKAGIIEFTKAIAREVAPYKIRVNCVSPGSSRPDSSRKSPPNSSTRQSKRHLGRGGVSPMRSPGSSCSTSRARPITSRGRTSV
jgi:NAD(P)-dependent dehydrogenase (short-subunit alcohol dehydrogenase family)